jgi:hypothetical protein
MRRHGAFPVDLPEDNDQKCDGAGQHEEAVQENQARYAENESCPVGRHGQGDEQRKHSLEHLPASHGEKTHQEKQGKDHVVDKGDREPRELHGSKHEYLNDQEKHECRQASLL